MYHSSLSTNGWAFKLLERAAKETANYSSQIKPLPHCTKPRFVGRSGFEMFYLRIWPVHVWLYNK